MVIYGASDGVIPFLVRDVLDKVFGGKHPEYLIIFPVILILITIIRAIADFFQQFLISKIGHMIVRDIRREMNSHFLRLNPDFFLSTSSAELVTRMTGDVLLMKSFLTESLPSILRDSLRIVALACAAIYLDPFLALLALVVFPLGVLPVQRLGKKLRRLSRRGQEAVGAMGSMLQESILGNRVVKVFGAESFEEQRFAVHNQALTNTFIKSEKFRAITGPLNEVLASLGAAAVIYYGGYSVLEGHRTQGHFVAFLLSVFLLYDPFKKLSRVHAQVQLGLAGAQRIFEILDTKPKIVDPVTPISLTDSNEIVFSDVVFTYPGAENPALKGVSLRLEEGKKTALVGLSGSGKSTLVDLIPRFIAPKSGTVSLGGIDISSVKLTDLRARLSLVGQHTFLFNDTISNNIRYGNLAASHEEIIAAAKSAFALDFIERLPLGFETVIGEGGHALSGGERQRLAIARAILKDAPILIMDEATASLDNRSEREVQGALESLERNRTTIVVAHRLSTIQNADKIIVMQGGFVVEQGTHADLLKQGGEYYRLYKLGNSEAA